MLKQNYYFSTPSHRSLTIINVVSYLNQPLFSSRTKSYSSDHYEYKTIFDPRSFLQKFDQEWNKLVPDLIVFYKASQYFDGIPTSLSEQLRSNCFKILDSNIYELIAFQLKNTLNFLETLIGQIIKEIDSPQPEVNTAKSPFRFESRKEKMLPKSLSLKTLRKARFLLSKLGFLLHLRDVSLGYQENSFEFHELLKLPSLAINIVKNSPKKKIHALSSGKEEIMKNSLQKYFLLKVNHWKKETFLKDNNHKTGSSMIENQMICKICLKAIGFKKMSSHTELCMEKNEIIRKIEGFKSYFNRFCLKAISNGRHYEKLYGIQKKNKIMKYSTFNNEPIKELKILIIDEKLHPEVYKNKDEISNKIELFPYDSPLHICKKEGLSEEKLNLIIRKVKLYDLIAKASSYFGNEEMKESNYIK